MLRLLAVLLAVAPPCPRTLKGAVQRYGPPIQRCVFARGTVLVWPKAECDGYVGQLCAHVAADGVTVGVWELPCVLPPGAKCEPVKPGG